MHEGGLITEAISAALLGHAAANGAGRPAGPDRLTAVLITIVDPITVGATACALYAEVALRRHGLGDVPVEVLVAPVGCRACGAANHPTPSRPYCVACGWPLPRGAGDGSPVQIATNWA